MLKAKVYLPTTVLVAVLLLPSCSGGKRLSTDDLRSDLTAAVSFASEGETFIDFVLQGRATSHFKSGHLHYRSKKLSDWHKNFTMPRRRLQQQVISQSAERLWIRSLPNSMPQRRRSMPPMR